MLSDDADRAIAEIRAAMDDPALTDEAPSSADAWMGCYQVKLACTTSNIRALLDRLAERDAEIERLRADAERFEYVIDHHARSDPDMSGQHHWMLMGRGIGRGQTIREAIDAAREKE